MAEDAFSDDTAREERASPQPDAHGQAAMLLVESLIHGLISKSVISVAEAVEIVEIAADVSTEIVADASASDVTASKPLTLLGLISKSLKPDIT